MKRILLTGAAGFLGSACAPLLRAAGHMLVTSDRHGSVELVGNLADSRFTSKLPDVDVVVHAAAVQYVSRDLPMLRRDAYFHENNIQATANLCQRYAKSDVHFVNIGTSMMSGGTGKNELSAADTPASAQVAEGRSARAITH